ncbi:MAG: sulfotransferase domain-containing protein [Gammaproteobacteria bacterium]|nr:sulfotransferase domain-containing protein [Gammaproteobacteria bacterium]MYF31641.1 sulfotransferase domain-containing protein [Gammaproteobacteria bacterium]
MNRNLIIAGIPRSGSTLTCSLVNRLPDVVALNETMNVGNLLALPDADSRVQAVADYFAETRRTIDQTGKMPQLRVAGSEGNMFLSDASKGRKSAKLGSALTVLGKVLPLGYWLALKHLNAFAALLPELRQRFDCFALVRNPLATLASWHTLDHPMGRGHMPVAEALDERLADHLASIDDGRERRLALLDWYYRRFTDSLTAERIQRYEDIMATNGGCLAEVVPSASDLPGLLREPLEGRNESLLYGAAVEAKADANALLEDHNHACWRVYEPAEVRALLRHYRKRVAAPQVAEAPMLGADEAGGYQPKVGFMIVGAQKCGTSVLWEYLAEHPEVGMSSPKEVQLFSGPDYSSEWSPQEIDRRYAPWFRHCPGANVRGEVTPIYLFFPEVAAELKRYNPDLKLIVLLRDAAERAISNYYMQRARGKEKAPLWLALLAEPWRLRRCANPRGWGSATRVCSYRARGLYSLQLRNLHRHFPSNQVLIVRSRDLQQDHHAVLRRVFAFLGVAEDVQIPKRTALPGDLHGKRRHPILSWMLRLSYLAERWRARGLYDL